MLHLGKAVCSCLSLFLLMLGTSHFHPGNLSFRQGHVRLSHLHHYSHPFQESPQPNKSGPLWYQALHETWKIGSLCPRGFGGQIQIQACGSRDFLFVGSLWTLFPTCSYFEDPSYRSESHPAEINILDEKIWRDFAHTFFFTLTREVMSSLGMNLGRRVGGKELRKKGRKQLLDSLITCQCSGKRHRS